MGRGTLARMPCSRSTGYRFHASLTLTHLHKANPKDPKKCHGHLERSLREFRYGQRSSISPTSTIQKSQTCPLKQQNTRQITLGYNSTTTAIQKGQENQLNLLSRKYKSYYTEGIILAARPW